MHCGYACNRTVLKETEKTIKYTIQTRKKKKKKRKTVTTQTHNTKHNANNSQTMKNTTMFGKTIWAANEMQYASNNKMWINKMHQNVKILSYMLMRLACCILHVIYNKQWRFASDQIEKSSICWKSVPISYNIFFNKYIDKHSRNLRINFILKNCMQF